MKFNFSMLRIIDRTLNDGKESIFSFIILLFFVLGSWPPYTKIRRWSHHCI